MVMQPRQPFFAFTCNACGWSKTVYQRSDVLERVHRCGKCGSESISCKASILSDLEFFLKNPKAGMRSILKAGLTLFK